MSIVKLKFNRVSVSSSLYRKGVELVELEFSYRHNLNFKTKPIEFISVITDPTMAYPQNVISSRTIYHKGDAFRISANFPIRLKFHEKKKSQE